MSLNEASEKDFRERTIEAINNLAATYARESALNRETMERCAKMQAASIIAVEHIRGKRTTIPDDKKVWKDVSQYDIQADALNQAKMIWAATAPRKENEG